MLAKQIKLPPIEVVLVEAAVGIMTRCSPSGCGALPSAPVSDVVPSAVLTFLRRRVLSWRPSLWQDGGLIDVSFAQALQNQDMRLFLFLLSTASRAHYPADPPALAAASA